MTRRAGRSFVDLTRARAHWVTRDLVAVPPTALPLGVALDGLDWAVEHAAEGGHQVTDRGAGDDVARDDVVPLDLVADALPGELAAALPHLAACGLLRLSSEGGARAEELLRGQVCLVGRDDSGRAVVGTSLQIPHVLDDLYAAAPDRAYGPVWHGAGEERRPDVVVWAPTAREVALLLWPEKPVGEPRRVPMERDADGAWTAHGEPGWRDRSYLLEVTVVAPPGRLHTLRVTDPWSVGLALGSTHSVLVDLEDERWAPEIWAGTPVPAPIRPVDQAIYELHVRDFSRDDDAVEEGLRGSYLAFAAEGHGRRHLRALAGAGLTTVHLLPVFDLTSVQEDPARQRHVDPAVLAALPPDSDEQQRLVQACAIDDAFNWGYDPFHFLAPEGSYASDADSAHGGERISQCRSMIGGLHEIGLRVVLDQVYNHTTDAGLAPSSVLDKVVPGYYHRLDPEGLVEHSTCCQNLATEHAMAQRLMVDGCVTWVRHYRVDGFRFDLMGHHSRANMEAVRAALDALTVQEHGVDGSAVTLYGEGWNFGEVAGNARFYQAVQGQLAGTAIGTFNDRLRDAVRGGSVHGADPRRGKGFATGGSDPLHVDQLQVGLAGNLRDIAFVAQSTGRPTTGEELPYGGAPTGYATSPEESVSYVDAHDNETLWDTLTLKLPRRTPMAERVRRNTLALATVTLSQGISFWHAGAELLRSKSLDRNSYASGDWFNRWDPTLTDNGFARGLPPRGDNGARWGLMAPLLADPALRPDRAAMQAALDGALDLLRLRRDLPLLRLGDAGTIRTKVSFPVSGGPGGRGDLVVMLVDDLVGQRVDPACSGVLVVLNAAAGPVDVEVPGLAGQEWSLSAVQQQGADDVVRTTRWDAGRGAVTVPALTAAVLVRS